LPIFIRTPLPPAIKPQSLIGSGSIVHSGLGEAYRVRGYCFNHYFNGSGSRGFHPHSDENPPGSAIVSHAKVEKRILDHSIWLCGVADVSLDGDGFACGYRERRLECPPLGKKAAVGQPPFQNLRWCVRRICDLPGNVQSATG
jgi:hypothetical protein